MPAKIIGIERLDYISRKTNKQVKGYNLHLAETLSKQGSVGQEAYSTFLSDDRAPAFAGADLQGLLGREIHVQYNKYGSAEGFVFADEKDKR